MSDLDNFIQISDALIQFNADVCGESLSGSSVHSLEVHRDELKEIWCRVKPTYEACLKELRHSPDDNAKKDLETVMARYMTTYQTYVSSVARLSECIEEKKAAKSAARIDTSLNSNHPSIHLPPCDTEIFSGDYMQWPTFRDLFTALYINNSRLSPVEKLFHLNNKTQGDAREVVRKAPLTHEGFEVAWKALQNRFENKRLLINSQLRALFNMEKTSTESGDSIKRVQSSINNIISALKLYDVDIRSWDPIFVYTCCTRLSETTLSLWEQSLKSKTESPLWRELDIFLTGRFQTLETVGDFGKTALPDTFTEKAKTTSKNQFPKRVNSYQNSLASPLCSLCPDQPHTIRLCPKFISMVYVDRLSQIRKLKLCLNCFAKGHTVKECKSAFNCMKCQQRHNTLLHKNIPALSTDENGISPLAKEPSVSPNISDSTIHSCASTNTNRVILGTAIITIIHMGEQFRARALFDSGSEASFISEVLYNRLKLPSRPSSIQISGLNGAISAKSQQICTFTMSSPLNSNISIEVSAIVIPKLTSALSTFSANREMFANLQNLPLADPEFYHTSYIDILIGADLFPHVMLEGTENGICGSLIAQRTIFGWILTGPVKSDTVSSFRASVSYLNEVNIEKQISRFWEVEDLPRRKIMSDDELVCEELYKKSTRRDSTGRYVVSLPFKQNVTHSASLGLSRNRAMAQYVRNETRLLKNPAFKEQYDNVIVEYIQLGHMKPVTDSDRNFPNYYLPHHAVVKPDSVTTKVRVVFNASNPTANGVSLNDVLHCGPSLQLDLTLLLLEWRFFKIVFNSDIEKMYRQIRVNPEHTKFQKVLYRTPVENEVREYELQTVTFGVNCAPYLALRTMHQLAADVKGMYPIASQIILSHMYVDDVLAGSHNVPSAIEAQMQLTKAMASAGFSLRKWTSNSEDFLKATPKEHLLNRDFLQFEDSSSAKTLGVRWNAKSDYFYFIVKEIKMTVTPTKRIVLSVICQLFDPAGWLCPFVVLAKLLMRDVWLTKIEWDDHLPIHLQKVWKEFLENYPLLERIRIPRWVNYYPGCDVQLHGFCDASEKAYAAVVYIRVQSPSGSIQTHLLNAKSRVSPLKIMSIPRLELCGAVLLAELIDSLTQNLSHSISRVFCWTDSTIVLAWLRKPAFHWKTFVANRVARISEIVDINHWSHVDSQDNPADLASRGLYSRDLISNRMWWSGPSWLQISPSLWPIKLSSHVDENNLEAKQVSCNCSYFDNYEDPLERFSKLDRALRVMAYVFRFIIRTRRIPNVQFNTTSIQKSEIIYVRNQLIILSQKVFYPKEYKNLSKRTTVDRNSKVANLNPFLDANGVIRVCGRLSNSESLSYDERHPIILPYNSLFSRLLLKFIHSITLHGGNMLMLRTLRLQFWISRAKNLIKTIIHQCKVCVISKHKLQKQLMSALPPERTSISRPFANTGLDFAGPFDVKAYAGRSRVVTKGYVCIFICFSTRSIHLELTSALSTPAFLSSFHRFVSRRGCPGNLYSDNGKNFVGASKELATNFLHCSRDIVTRHFEYQNIVWHFIPPGPPHMGGLWEAGVKSFKLHFRKMAGNYKFTFEEFSTMLSRIEACLNSRPISPISENPNDLLALTPGHFLIGSPLLSIAEPKESETNLSIMNRWRRVRALSQQFNVRWKHEYLKELHKRNKWQRPQKNITINDMVVIREECSSPTDWRLGRVSKLFPGKDGLVRVAEIVTQKGTITRPLVKLVLLPAC